MFDPPSKTNWHYTGWFSQSYADAYTEGYEAAKNGLSDNECPYEESGHERDTTYADELNYWWNKGFHNFKEGGG